MREKKKKVPRRVKRGSLPSPLAGPTTVASGPAVAVASGFAERSHLHPNIG